MRAARNKRIVLSLRVPEALHAKLGKSAKANHRSINAEILAACESYLSGGR